MVHLAASNILEQPFINITNIIWSFDHTTNRVNILLVKRDNQPYNGYWALPETFMRFQESADEAALRLVKEKIGMALSGSHTEQLATFTNKLRTPGDRTLSLAYMTFLPDKPQLKAGYGASDARWFSMGYADNCYTFSDGQQTFQTAISSTETMFYAKFTKANLDPTKHLAFDHEWILKIACDRIRNKLDYQPNILLVLGAKFTLKDARMVYSPFLKTPVNKIDNSNFKKSHNKLFTDMGTTTENRPGRPARVYKLAAL
ncbi:MAG: NUDIX domain-containing protein [Lentilactobacillus diolivorans]